MNVILEALKDAGIGTSIVKQVSAPLEKLLLSGKNVRVETQEVLKNAGVPPNQISKVIAYLVAHLDKGTSDKF